MCFYKLTKSEAQVTSKIQSKICFQYIETDDEGTAVRELIEFEDGTIVRYDLVTFQDDNGMLTDKHFEIENYAKIEILERDFEKVWSKK
jgi:hypothetical protein